MDRPYINIHTHRPTGEGIEFVDIVGIHPWQLGDGFDLETALCEMETAPASAIGEIGLDYAVSGDRGEQKMIFSACLRIAEARGLPVILHCVKAFEPAMEILAGFRLPAVIFHGFTGSREQAARAMRSGYCLSLGERSLNSPKTVEALKTITLDKLFLETDDAPVSIAEIYARAAGILAVSVEELTQNIYCNYTRLFSTRNE